MSASLTRHLASSRVWLADRWWDLRDMPRDLSLAVRWQVRKARGLGGDFERPKDSDRCRALSELWDSNWPASEPIGYLLRARYEERWVRFHNLPESKRWPDTPEEFREIIRRQRTVIAELAPGTNIESLVVIAVDYSTLDGGGWSKQSLPGAWPWRIGVDDLEDPDDHTDDYRWYFWVKTGLAASELDALLAAIADNQSGRALIAAPDLDWLFCPYDGGADVILPTAEARDALRDQHPDWLSTGSDGL